ncbi:MAG TPA: DUF1059 domain-containing protein [bacterium]|nr:DUF1059 domain-containing protein [bacterium]
MHTHMHCPVCGTVLHADSDEAMVKKAQEHMGKVHQQTISREEVLRQAHEAHH